MNRIDGWLTSLDAGLTAAVGAFQQKKGLRGSVGEIGIHHGRLFLVLALGMMEGERAFAIDVFDDQGLNLDRSGRGDEAIFRSNLARHAVRVDDVTVLRRSSLDLCWADIQTHVGQLSRLSSVDGGHTAEVVQHDLEIMEDGLAEHGVIVLDDYYTAEYPAVSEGTARFFVSRPGAIVPFAIGDSRMLLCRPAWADAYRVAMMQTDMARYFIKETPLWDGTVGIFRTPTKLLHHLRRSRLSRTLRDHPIGLKLKPIIRRLFKD